jgi:hypothetical protein
MHRRGVLAAAAGAACALAILGSLTPRVTVPAQLLGAQQRAAWDKQEASLWRQPAGRGAVRAEASRAAAAAHSEAKLKQIVGSLRKSHLLRRQQLRQIAAPQQARQPHFGPGKVVELSQTPNGMRVFEGRMLCAEGETTCVHPCNAFYTITGEEPPEDCKCTCTSPNPHSFYKAGSVICNCPGSPIAPENDMYPYPPGEGPMAAIEAAQAAAAAAPVSTASAPSQDGSSTPSLNEERASFDADAAAASASAHDAGDETSPQQEASEAPEAAAAPDAAAPAMRGVMPVSLSQGSPMYYGAKQAMQLEKDIDERLAHLGVKVEPLEHMQPVQMPAGAPYGMQQRPYGLQQQRPYAMQGPQGLYVGGGVAFLPPDGDYPGGSTGIPMDGYLAFDTGHGQQPYHGTLSPMQEAGIADRAPTTSLLRQRARRVRVLKTALGQPKVALCIAALYSSLFSCQSQACVC